MRKTASEPALRDEINRWITLYFEAFIDIAAGKRKSDEILRYWSVPLHMSSPRNATWLTSPEEVVGVLDEMQRALKQVGYTHTEALEKAVTVYSQNNRSG